MSKSQSALEYMMTYGWAILIIVLVAAVLFSFGIFNPTTNVTSTPLITGFSDVPVTTAVANNSFFKIAITNQYGQTIRINNVTVLFGSTTFAQNNCTNVVLTPGQYVSCYIKGVFSGSTISVIGTIFYTLVSSNANTSTTGTIRVQNLNSAVYPSSVISCSLSYSKYTFSDNSSGGTDSLQYSVSSPSTFVVLAAASGFDPFSTFKMPSSCYFVERQSSSDALENATLAVCPSQSAGTYYVNDTQNSNYVSLTAYVFGGSACDYTVNGSSSSTVHNVAVSLSASSTLFLCDGASGNGNEYLNYTTADVNATDSEIGHQSTDICNGYTRAPGNAVSLIGFNASTAAVTSFTETGLPAATLWSAKYHNITESTSSSTIEFATSNGNFSYMIPNVGSCTSTIYVASPSSGYIVAGSTELITFSSQPCVYTNFTESGLPSSAYWKMEYDGQTIANSAATKYFRIPAGNYSFLVSTANYTVSGCTTKYAPSSASGYKVTGSLYTITFSVVSTACITTFTESGLPSGTNWNITYDTLYNTSTSTSVKFTTASGNFSFTAYNVSSGGCVFKPSKSGGYAVAGTTKSLTYSATSCVTTFGELGLPLSTLWNITYANVSAGSNKATINITTNKSGSFKFSGIPIFYNYCDHYPSPSSTSFSAGGSYTLSFVNTTPTCIEAFVANNGSDSLSVINGTLHSATLSVGLHPSVVEYNPKMGLVFVANPESNTTSIINGTTNIDNLSVGWSPVLLNNNGEFGNESGVYVGDSKSDLIEFLNYTNSARSSVSIKDTYQSIKPEQEAYDSANGYMYFAQDYNALGAQLTLIVNSSSDNMTGSIYTPVVIQNVTYDPNNKFIYETYRTSTVCLTPCYGAGIYVINGTKIIANYSNIFPNGGVSNYVYDSANGYMYYLMISNNFGIPDRVYVFNGVSMVGNISLGTILSNPSLMYTNGYVYVVQSWNNVVGSGSYTGPSSNPARVLVIQGTALVGNTTDRWEGGGVVAGQTETVGNGYLYVGVSVKNGAFGSCYNLYNVSVISGTANVNNITLNGGHSQDMSGCTYPMVFDSVNNYAYIGGSNETFVFNGASNVANITEPTVSGSPASGSGGIYLIQGKNGYIYDGEYTVTNIVGLPSYDSVISGTSRLANVSTDGNITSDFYDSVNKLLYGQFTHGSTEYTIVINGTQNIGTFDDPNGTLLSLNGATPEVLIYNSTGLLYSVNVTTVTGQALKSKMLALNYFKSNPSYEGSAEFISLSRIMLLNNYRDLQFGNVSQVVTSHGAVKLKAGPDNSNIYPGTAYALDSTNERVDFINITTGLYTNPVPQLITSAPVQTQPSSMFFDSLNNLLYVTNSGSNTVSVLNATSYKNIANLSVGTNPSALAYDSVNKLLYVADSGSNNVDIINTSTDAVISTIAVGTDPVAIAYGEIGHFVYVANYNSNTISVINGTAVIGTVSVGTNPDAIATASPRL